MDEKEDEVHSSLYLLEIIYIYVFLLQNGYFISKIFTLISIEVVTSIVTYFAAANGLFDVKCRFSHQERDVCYYNLPQD